jgi:uncharacterized LabA/DUF88 family protein
MNRVTFLVDGFNLYHSVVQAECDNGGHCVKWLDLRRLCLSYLHMVRRQVNAHVELETIHYFSAPPTHRPSGTQKRHAIYMKCLESAGIHVHLGRFKKKTVECHLCHRDDVRHEEKETDVAMAALLLEVCHSGEADSVVMVTGDTDLAPAVRTCQRLFPEGFICFAFPYKRHNAELKVLAPGSFNIGRDSYLRHQFSDPLQLADGGSISMPAEW